MKKSLIVTILITLSFSIFANNELISRANKADVDAQISLGNLRRQQL